MRNVREQNQANNGPEIVSIKIDCEKIRNSRKREDRNAYFFNELCYPTSN